MKHTFILMVGGVLMSFLYLNSAQECACGEDADGDGFCSSNDCDDGDDSAYPGAEEVCDGVDNDCNGLVDELDDLDEDLYTICDDCDDSAPDVYPGAPELCDGVDNDCDGSIPAAEQDVDRDDFSVCEGDCDDTDRSSYPGADEVCDGVDNDCDSTLPDNEADGDGDGSYACAGDCDDQDPFIYEGAEEICDSMDQDCDGLIDASSAGNAGWVRSVCGAVLEGGTGAFDAKGVDQGDVIYNSDLDVYQMWFRTSEGTGTKRIGYAESDDGFNWAKHNGAVLGVGPEGSWDEIRIGYPSVDYSDGTFTMWYQGQDAENNIQIGVATSSDGLNWAKYQGNPVLTVGLEGSWNSKVVQAPAVLFDGTEGLYHMWYTGGDGSFFQVGYASSTDGLNWTDYSGNPVLEIGPTGSWDSKRSVFARVRALASGFQMWYAGDDITNSYTYEIGYASSSDGVNWLKSLDNPVFSFGATGDFDSYMVYAGDVIELPDGFAMYYSGGAQTSGPYAIGMARNVSPTATDESASE